MLYIMTTDGAALKSAMTAQEFFAATEQASPSPWVLVTTSSLGDVYINTMAIAYVHEVNE